MCATHYLPARQKQLHDRQAQSHAHGPSESFSRGNPTVHRTDKKQAIVRDTRLSPSGGHPLQWHSALYLAWCVTQYSPLQHVNVERRDRPAERAAESEPRAPGRPAAIAAARGRPAPPRPSRPSSRTSRSPNNIETLTLCMNKAPQFTASELRTCVCAGF